MTKENQKLKKLMDWITSHGHAWDMICGPGVDSFSVQECMDIMQSLVNEELYSVAAVLLEKLMRDKEIHDIVGRLASARVCGYSNEGGFLSECIAAVWTAADESGTLNRIISY